MKNTHLNNCKISFILELAKFLSQKYMFFLQKMLLKICFCKIFEYDMQLQFNEKNVFLTSGSSKKFLCKFHTISSHKNAITHRIFRIFQFFFLN